MSRFIRLIRLPLLAGACLVVCGLIGPMTGEAQAPLQRNVGQTDEAQIKKAIERGQKYLLASLAQNEDPFAAVAVIALLKSGMTRSTPQINDVCERLAKHVNGSTYTPGQHHVYEAGVTLLALANADSRKYRSHIGAIARYIIAHQGRQGFWGYLGSVEGDTSISQYAMLGLWEASRVGIPIPSDVWDKAANWHIRTQQRDGGFAYHPASMTPNTASLHSMTVAGIGSLRISRRYLFSDRPRTQSVVEATPAQPPAPKKNRSGKRFGILEPIIREEKTDDENPDPAVVEVRNTSYTPMVRLEDLDSSVDQGIDWMTKHFTVDRPTGYPIYYLYGLERASALAELKTYGSHDWYAEGSAHLVATQETDGSWRDVSGQTTGTAFGILFLVKATSKMVAPEVPRVEFGSGILVGGRGLPDNLKNSELNDSKDKKPKKKSSLEDLLAQLENPQIPLVEATQEEIVEQVVIGDRAKLIGQVDRLKKLAKHPDAEVRRTALWALGRSDDLRLAPILIAALQDANVDVFVEARNALRCLSRQVEDFSLKEGPLDAPARDREWKKWKDWYKQVRAYDERDPLVGPGE